jgi:hypothetical protein
MVWVAVDRVVARVVSIEETRTVDTDGRLVVSRVEGLVGVVGRPLLDSVLRLRFALCVQTHYAAGAISPLQCS